MAKTSSAPKTKKAASLPAHPKYEDMIRDAIVALKDRKGSSRQAIKKYILTSFKLPDNNVTNNRLRIAINKGVEKGLFAFYNGPSGTIKLVKKEPVKKEKKEVEKKEKPKTAVKKESKPKAEKKTKKAAPKKTAKKAVKKTKKPTTKTTKRTKAAARKVGARKSSTRKRTTS
ncbi:9431_t:CDS:2 [Cetraspora pellucida]|uniref:Histone H1 n=1 Tax=Cetraspora pellucida TaxID=1433469 RepID=A0A9N8WLF0_9GLOM|nr:9431_t:CDS:2 [Cetraspora pellucida]